MSHVTFTDVVETTAKKFKIPGVAVGVFADGKEVYACHGVTSLDNRGRSSWMLLSIAMCPSFD